MKVMLRIPLAIMGLLSAWTAAGASLGLLKDVGDNDISASSNPLFLGTVGTRGYFAARTFNGTPRLYRTDGTPASTTAVVTADTLNSPTEGVTIGGRLVFRGLREPSALTSDLWSSDGTDAGTTRIAQLGHSERAFTWLGVDPQSRGFFTYGHFATYQRTLFVTDGTSAGTRAVLANHVVEQAVMRDGNLYFFAFTEAGSDYALWVSDGTVSGTQQLVALSETTLTGVQSLMHVTAGTALLAGEDGQGRGVFSVALGTGATTRLANMQSGVSDRGVRLGGLQFHVQDYDLWRTDGTESGTFRLADADNFRGVEGPLTVIGDRVLFVNNSETEGSELWVSNGTLAGTQMLHEILPGLGGFVRLLASTSTHAFYVAGESGGPIPARFWVTDGTTQGSRVIPLEGSADYDIPISTVQRGLVAGNRVFFTITHNMDIPGGSLAYLRLFSTDLAGSAAIDAGPSGPGIALGDAYLFSSETDPSGAEPWISDGTQAGTARLADIALSGQTNSSAPEDFTMLGDIALFEADDGDSGRELWRSDGTADGTWRIRDILPGPGSSSLSGMRTVGDLAYFVASSTGGVQDGPGRLWRTDGTEAGTFPLGDTRAIAGGGSGGGCANWSTLFNGRAWFFGVSEVPQGTELWSTDGTVSGTRREFLLPEATRFASHCELHATPNGLIFIHDAVPNAQLWRSDGTLQGTVPIPDVRPANVAAGSGFTQANVILSGGVAYLLADGGDGFEPWRSDGTVAGTAQIRNLAPGVEGAQIYYAVPFGEGIVFQYASESGLADGLWIVPAAGSDATRIKSGWVTQRPVNAGSRVYFRFNNPITDAESLWVTDGTDQGTRQILSAPAGALMSIDNLAGFNGKLFFTGDVAGVDPRVWVTDGSVGGERSLGQLPGLMGFPAHTILLRGRPLLAIETAALGVEPYIVRNAAPVAAADAAAVSAGSSTNISVRANDSDSDSAAADLAIIITTAPAHGTATVQSGTVRYTPTAGFTGNDSFQYRLADELGAESEVATVTVTVNASSGGGGGDGGGGGGGGGRLDLLALVILLLIGERRLRARLTSH
jgi:ELWxxDGT repeat protein